MICSSKWPKTQKDPFIKKYFHIWCPAKFWLNYFLDDRHFGYNKKLRNETGGLTYPQQNQVSSTYMASEHSYQMCTKASQVVHGSSHGGVRIMQSLIN
jgi:hypothetical protein